MAGAAENRFGEGNEFIDGLMDLATGLLGICLDPVLGRIFKDTLHLGVAHRPVDRLQQIALDKREPSARLVIAAVHSVTDDAGNAFA